MIAVIGAGAMGAALAIVHRRAGVDVALLGTAFDDATIDACASGRPHPALGVPLPSGIDCRRHDRWGAVLRNTQCVVLGISSDGLADVVAEVGPVVRPGTLWVVATKGWDKDTLRTPSEIVAPFGDRVVVLGGPALAPELVAGAPTVMVCASTDARAAAEVASTLETAGLAPTITDDVVGAEIGSAYKNVTAIAVGMAEGLSERLPESVYVHRFANARAALFALGLQDMTRLAVARGGRPETIQGQAGAGDLYVTCLGGRNGNFGRLLGAGQTPEQALSSIGSTVEGVSNTAAALAVAGKLGVDLVVARAVDSVLTGRAAPDAAVADALRTG